MRSHGGSDAVREVRGGLVLGAAGEWGLEPLCIAEGRFSEAAGDGRILDARGCMVLPGIVDFHGDAFERLIMPRPQVNIPLGLALAEADRQLAANGITTAFHGITCSWEGGLRGRDNARRVIDGLRSMNGHASVSHQIHLRFECHDLESEASVGRWLADGDIDFLAFNEHLPGMRRKPHRLREYADRAGLSEEAFMARLEVTASRGDAVPQAVARLAALAREHGVPMASHDDDSCERRDHFERLGCGVSEFPLNVAVARRARERGAAIVCGAPNVLRGGSHVGAPKAADLALEGLCDVLASDYYYPAPLAAAFRLAGETGIAFPVAWAMVSLNPARAAGLADRGRIECGAVADLILVDDQDDDSPRVVATVSRGRLVYLAPGASLHD